MEGALYEQMTIINLWNQRIAGASDFIFAAGGKTGERYSQEIASRQFIQSAMKLPVLVKS